MDTIPEAYRDLLDDAKKAFVFLGTTMKDGSPQVTPIWFNTDGKYILINTAVDRQKDRNMRDRPKVALCISDPGNPYRYVQIRGKVVERATQGADAHIDALNFKYHGVPTYQNRQPGQVRVIYKILPEKVHAQG